MRITRLSLTNFRGFEGLELDLDRPVTVLVGVNGSGKSSVLKALCAVVVSVQRVLPSLARFSEIQLNRRDVRAGTQSSEIDGSVEHDGQRDAVHLRWLDHMQMWAGQVKSPDFWGLHHRIFAFHYGTDRRFSEATVPTNGTNDAFVATGLSLWHPGYQHFLTWFKEREDAENARRVAARDFDLQDPQLKAVREAVAAVMPGFERLRIERDPTPAMVATKDGIELRLDQLSDGERNLIALVGDLARRVVLADPTSESPRETEGLVLIDEVEQHLHPAWQRRVIPALRRAFPKMQLVVTTHSPQVISSVPESAVLVLDGSAAHAITSATQGRDTNAILREVFGVADRPEAVREEIAAIASLIDGAQLSDARARLAALAHSLSERDEEVLRLRTKLDFAEVGL